MVAALIQWQIQFPGESVWTNITGRVIGEAVFREGRTIEQLGGPEVDGRTSSLSLILNNSSGYFTKGAGAAYEAGSQIRLRWRTAITDAWEVRYRGSLSESRSDFRTFAFIRTRWLGNLWKLKSGTIPERTVIGTIGEIVTEIATAAGIAATDQNFPTGGDNYGLRLQKGYAGARDFLGLVRATMFDDPEGRVTLETETVRAARAVSQTYRETGAGELTIPPPRSLSLPFGIINDLELTVQVFNPTGMAADTMEVAMPNAIIDNASEGWVSSTLTVTLDAPPTTPTVQAFSFTFTSNTDIAGSGDDEIATFTVDQDTTGETDATFVVARQHPTDFTGHMGIRNLMVSLAGSLVTVTFEARQYYYLDITPQVHLIWPAGSYVDMTSGTVTLGSIASFEQEINTYDFAGCDLASIARYGLRPRETPLLLAIQRTTPPPVDYEPPADLVSDAIAAELARYANPVPVVAFDLDSGTTARRDDLMARRLGQKVHITADGPSQLGHDADFYIEAQEVRISPLGELAATLWCVQTP